MNGIMSRQHPTTTSETSGLRYHDSSMQVTLAPFPAQVHAGQVVPVHEVLGEPTAAVFVAGSTTVPNLAWQAACALLALASTHHTQVIDCENIQE
eukprot:m.103903 g.103903  ORF g.103903 m.103903 type:complete len:95 (-) comp15232_c1_seq11:2293-2577(-)